MNSIWTSFLVLGLVLGSTVLFADSDQPGYYWRDYRGPLPDDAVPFSLDRSYYLKWGYIGRVYILNNRNQLVPTPIILQNYTKRAEQVVALKRGYEVLCSPNLEKFTWRRVKNRRFVRRNLTEEEETDRPQYDNFLIARALCDEFWFIGRTVDKHTLRMRYGCNNTMTYTDNFELLAYRTN